MPQMHPMNWNMLFLLNMISFLFFFCYFYFLCLNKNTTKNYNLKPIKMNLKW